MQHSFKMSDKATRRLAWHPQLENLLAVASEDKVCFINVPPTSGVATSPELSQPVVPSGPMTEGIITCLAFNDKGDMLAVSDDLGFVYVWSLPAEMDSQQQVRCSAIHVCGSDHKLFEH